MKKIISLVAAAALTACVANAKVIATVDGKNVTSQEVNKAAQLFLGGKDVLTLPKAEQQRVIKMYVVQEAITKQAIKEGLEKTKLFKELMATARENALSNVYQDQIFKKIKVSDKQAMEVYNSHKETFMVPARIQIKQLILKDEAKIKEFYAGIKGLKGKKLEEKFVSLGTKLGANPSSLNSVWLTDKNIPSKYSKLLIDLKVNAYSKPQKTEYGYFVFYKQASQAAKQLSFAEVKDDIKANIQSNEYNKQMADLAMKIVKKAHIVYK